MFLECPSQDDHVIQIGEAVHSFSLTRMVSMMHWNVAGALHNLKCMTLNSNSPSGVQKAVF